MTRLLIVVSVPSPKKPSSHRTRKMKIPWSSLWARKDISNQCITTEGKMVEIERGKKGNNFRAVWSFLHPWIDVSSVYSLRSTNKLQDNKQLFVLRAERHVISGAQLLKRRRWQDKQMRWNDKNWKPWRRNSCTNKCDKPADWLKDEVLLVCVGREVKG